MKFTLDWLLEHIDTKASVSLISETLTSMGIEVEDIFDMSQKFCNFVVGQIVSCDKHPNADKLSLCKVLIGNEKILNIVCGASNVVNNMKVAVALPGAMIPFSGEILKRGKIRGIESEGMMCSCKELGLIGEGEGIIKLPEEAIVGESLSKALNAEEIIFDVTVTPNRGDCMSVRGIARLLASAGVGSFKELTIPTLVEYEGSDESVEIKTSDCMYFSTKVLTGINHSIKTPEFIKSRLEAIGQKLIYPPVDIANYICIDIGQPLHIFDLEKIPEHKLIVRNATNGENLDTLDDKNTSISEEAIVISNIVGEPLSIAGIIGGVSSSFSENTKNILIESAYFNKVAISLAGQRMCITTDSRIRNERGTDPEMVDVAINYAASLIGANKIYKTKKFGKLPENNQKLTLTFEKFHNITGLNRAGWKYGEKDIVEILSPSHRHDLNIEEDLVEEMLISYGYDNITGEDLERVDSILDEYTEDKMADVLSDNGYYEIKTFSFIDEETVKLFESEEAKIIKIENPLNNEFTVLRTTVVASILKNIKNNQNKNQENCKFFEIGKKFILEGKAIKEVNMLTMVISGKDVEKNWQIQQKDVSVFDIKRDIEKVFSSLDISKYMISQSDLPKYYHPGRSGKYLFRNNIILGYFGEIHPRVLLELGIDIPVVVAEILLNEIPEKIVDKKKAPLFLSQFPSIIRDFSFVVDKNFPASVLLEVIKKNQIGYVREAIIFDVYDMGDSKKAIGVEVIMQSDRDTLNDKEISEISEEIISRVKKECGGILRV